MKTRGLLLFVIFFLISGYCFAKTLELVTLQYPPYVLEHNGEIKGIALEIVEEAFRRMQQPVNVKLLPWARALKYIKRGKADAIFTAFKNPERETFMVYSKEVLINQTISLFVRKDSNIIFDGDLKKLSNYRFGVVRKVSYGKIFDGVVKNKYITKIDIAETGEMNMDKLLDGQLDILVSNKYGAFYILKKMNKIDEVKELRPKVENVPSYIAFSKKRNLTSLRDKFDLILKEMINDGTYNKIIDSYLE